MLADDFLNDHPVLVEQKAFGDPGGLVNPLDVAGAVLENLEADPELLDEALDVSRIPLVNADCKDAETFGAELARGASDEGFPLTPARIVADTRTALGRDIIGRLKAALLCEIASWFIGIGEIKAAVTTAAELPERLAALLAALRAVGAAGLAAEAGVACAIGPTEYPRRPGGAGGVAS